MITLGVETSCDETSVALVEGARVLANEVSSSVHLHSKYGGVVPEIASRFHNEYIIPAFDKALKDAGKSVEEIDLIAVTKGPGLPGSLLVGISFAKALSFAAEKPIIGVDHLKAHLFSCFLGRGASLTQEKMFPFIGMVVSGGHTGLYDARSMENISVIERTKDDAAGEAFDKVAKLLGLGYPGGPIIEKRACVFDKKRVIDFPRALLKVKSDLDFSFSGIKTAVMYHWQKCRLKTEEEIGRICFSFQKAVTDVIVEKARRALKKTGYKQLCIGGGVVNNKMLREDLASMCGKESVELFLAPPEYCTDNAAMIAALGARMFDKGQRSDLYMKCEL